MQEKITELTLKLDKNTLTKLIVDGNLNYLGTYVLFKMFTTYPNETIEDIFVKMDDNQRIMFVKELDKVHKLVFK